MWPRPSRCVRVTSHYWDIFSILPDVLPAEHVCLTNVTILKPLEYFKYIVSPQIGRWQGTSKKISCSLHILQDNLIAPSTGQGIAKAKGQEIMKDIDISLYKLSCRWQSEMMDLCSMFIYIFGHRWHSCNGTYWCMVIDGNGWYWFMLMADIDLCLWLILIYVNGWYWFMLMADIDLCLFTCSRRWQGGNGWYWSVFIYM